MIPPAWMRRPVTVTVWLALSVVFLALSPLLLLIGALAAKLTGRSQPAIIAHLAITYFARELAVMAACGALWAASAGGALLGTQRFQLMHWRLLRWFVHGIADPVRSLLRVNLQEEASGEAIGALESTEPLIVLSRHAGPADTIFLVDQLLSRFGRRPSIVFKQTLALDPGIDLIAHRLPHVVLDPEDTAECEARIETVTSKLGSRGALLLFPEGGNFTPERRRRAIRSLGRRGERRAARVAQRMSHVLPPRPSGVQASLRGSPGASVVFAAHTGLGLAAYPLELWRDAPIGRTLYTRMWLVPADEIPTDPEQQVEWLNGWWTRIDAWIDGHRTEPRFS